MVRPVRLGAAGSPEEVRAPARDVPDLQMAAAAHAPAPPALAEPLAVGLPAAVDLAAIALPQRVRDGFPPHGTPVEQALYLLERIHPLRDQIAAADRSTFPEALMASGLSEAVTLFRLAEQEQEDAEELLSSEDQQHVLQEVIRLAVQHPEDLILQRAVIGKLGELLSAMNGPHHLLPDIMGFFMSRGSVCQDEETAASIVLAVGQLAFSRPIAGLEGCQSDSAKLLRGLQHKFPSVVTVGVRMFLDNVYAVDFNSDHGVLAAEWLLMALRTSTDAELRRQILESVMGLAGKYFEAQPAEEEFAAVDAILWPLLRTAGSLPDKPVNPENGEWAAFCGIQAILQPPAEKSALKKLPRRVMANFEKARRAGCVVPEEFREAALRVARGYAGEDIGDLASAPYLVRLSRETGARMGGLHEEEGRPSAEKFFQMCAYLPARTEIAMELSLCGELRPVLEAGPWSRLFLPGFLAEWDAATMGERPELLDRAKFAAAAPILFPGLVRGRNVAARGGFQVDRETRDLLAKGIGNWSLRQKKIALLASGIGPNAHPIRGLGQNRVVNKAFAMVEQLHPRDLRTADAHGVSPADVVEGMVRRYHVARTVVIASVVVAISATIILCTPVHLGVIPALILVPLISASLGGFPFLAIWLALRGGPI